MESEMTLTRNGIDYQISLENTKAPDAYEDDLNALNKVDYIHWSSKFNLYFLISYTTGGGRLLDIDLHDYGQKPTVVPLEREDFNREAIRKSVKETLDITLSDEQLDCLIDCYTEGGHTITSRHLSPEDDFHDRIFRFTDANGIVGIQVEAPLDGWDEIFTEDEFENIDPNEEVPGTAGVLREIFIALRDNAPNCHNFSDHGHTPDYVARVEFPEPEDWQLRALELFQHSILNSDPELCKVQALREQGFSPHALADKLGKHRSTISQQLAQIDERLPRVEWTAKHVNTN